MKKQRYLLLSLMMLVGSGLAPVVAQKAGQEAQTSVTSERPKWVSNAVLYEVFVQDFTPEGTFRAMIPRLSELKDLGVTTLWLMPIHPYGVERKKGELGSPYAIQDYFDVNPAFGTKEDFQDLVDAVHAEGMHILIDFVANHTAWDNAWLAKHPTWYTQDSTGTIIHPEGTDWTDVADLNYDNPDVRQAMKQALKYWVEAFNIDGYRCDVAEMVPLDFWENAISEVRKIKPVMMLAEGEDPELHRVGFDLTYSWKLYRALKSVWNGAPASDFVDVLQEQEQLFPEEALRLRFTTNHDETAWDAPPPVLFGGLEGARAASVLMTTIRGVPLLYNGQEVGVAEPLPLFEKQPIDWEQNPELRAFYKKLLGLYDRSRALRRGTMTMLAPEAPDVLLYERAMGNARLLVAVNVRDREVPLPSLPEGLQGTSFKDAFSGEAADVPASLPPYGYVVLRVDREGDEKGQHG